MKYYILNTLVPVLVVIASTIYFNTHPDMLNWLRAHLPGMPNARFVEVVDKRSYDFWRDAYRTMEYERDTLALALAQCYTGREP